MKSEIETRSFSDVLEIRNGKDQKKVQSPDGAYPIYGSGGEMGRASAYLCPAETIILGRKGSINSPIFVREPFWNVDTAFGLIANRIILDPVYLFHFCKSFDFSKLNTTVTIPSLTKANLLKVRLPVPSMETQKSIAARLGKVCDLIDKRQAQLAQLDTLAKSLFVEMFGDPATNPSNWKTERLKSCSELLSDGPFGSNLKSSHYVDSGVRVIRLQNIGVGTFLDDDKAFISNSHYDSLKRFTCRPGEVVIGTLGDPNLRACLVPSHIGCAINKSDCVHCIPNHELLLEAFVVAYINSPGTLSLVSGDIHGQTRSRVSSGQLAKMPIFLPPLSLQHAFSERVEAIDKSKFAILRWLSYFDREAATKSARRGLSPAPWRDRN